MKITMRLSERTLLHHLLSNGSPEDYLQLLDDIETKRGWIKESEKNIAAPSDEWKHVVHHKYSEDRTSYVEVPAFKNVEEYIAKERECLESYKQELEEHEEELKDMRAGWKPEKEPNMDEEIELIKKWVKWEREGIINE